MIATLAPTQARMIHHTALHVKHLILINALNSVMLRHREGASDIVAERRAGVKPFIFAKNANYRGQSWWLVSFFTNKRGPFRNNPVVGCATAK